MILECATLKDEWLVKGTEVHSSARSPQARHHPRHRARALNQTQDPILYHFRFLDRSTVWAKVCPPENGHTDLSNFWGQHWKAIIIDTKEFPQTTLNITAGTRRNRWVYQRWLGTNLSHSWENVIANTLYIEPQCNSKNESIIHQRSYNIVLRGMTISSLGVVKGHGRFRKCREQGGCSPCALVPHSPLSHLQPKVCT